MNNIINVQTIRNTTSDTKKKKILIKKVYLEGNLHFLKKYMSLTIVLQ